MSPLRAWASRAWRGEAVDPVRALVHPVWIASLVILVVNDHALKGAGILPAVITGKLSDLSGLVVAPPLFAALLRTRTRGRLLLAHAAVGAVFAALDLSPAVAAIWRIPFAAIGVGWQSAHDPTDLLALPMLAVSWWIAARPPLALAGPQLAQRTLAVAGLVGCMATSQENFGPSVQPAPCVDCDGDGWPATLDCNDNDPGVNPDQSNCVYTPIEQSCDDGIDDDGDGLTDCADPDCYTACAAVEALCASPPAAQGTLTGTTLGVTGAMEGSCVGADAPEAAFTFLPTAPLGILEIDVPPGHGVYIRTRCDTPSSEIVCVPPGEGPLQMLVGPEALFIVVDADTAFDAAEFSVPFAYQPLVCGDGIVAGPEECDDGNVIDGDGCSALCTSELPFYCADPPPLVLGMNPGDTTSAPSLIAGSCGGGGPERLYGFVAPSDGTLSLSLASAGDLALHVRTACPDAASESACADAADAGGTETLDVPLTAGQAITVLVDSSASAADAAPFILTASFAP